jgi:hypothetical protein
VPSPAFKAPAQIAETAYVTAKEYAKAQEDEDVDWKKLSGSWLMSAGYIFKLPAAQLKIALDAIFDTFDEEQEVRPLDYFWYRKR